MDNKQLGQFGEDTAVEYLLQKGYKILGRNYVKVWDYRAKGEIDIVAKKAGVISFIEVKTSLSSNNFFPEDRVDYKKQRKLIRLAQAWLRENNVSLESLWQIDVVSVSIDRENNPKISYFENVFAEG